MLSERDNARRLFDEVDDDGSGLVAICVFKNDENFAFQMMCILKNDDLNTKFNYQDANELKALAERLGLELTTEGADEAMTAIDIDGDGSYSGQLLQNPSINP